MKHIVRITFQNHAYPVSVYRETETDRVRGFLAVAYWYLSEMPLVATIELVTEI